MLITLHLKESLPLKLQLGYRAVGVASDVMPWLWAPLSLQEIIYKITTAKPFV